MKWFKSLDLLKKYTLAGAILVLISGTLLHFVYEWSGNAPVAGLFSPVNESTWEHMKLCFFPLLLYTFFAQKKLRTAYPCSASALPAGILLGTFLIPVFFYTYSGILGRNLMALDIATFAVSVLLAFYAIYRLSLSCVLHSRQGFLWFLVLILGICFLCFTYHPPGIGLFADPVSSLNNFRHSCSN